MNKLKNYLLATGHLVILVAAFTLIGGPAVLSGESRSTHKGGTKVVTLAEDLLLDVGESAELDPVEVGQFPFVALLGTHNGGFHRVGVYFGFSTEEGKLSDPVSRSRSSCGLAGGPEGGIVFCDQTALGIPGILRVGGPFLVVRLTNETDVTGGPSPVLVTLKAFLSK